MVRTKNSERAKFKKHLQLVNRVSRTKDLANKKCKKRTELEQIFVYRQHCHQGAKLNQWDKLDMKAAIQE